MAVDQRAIVAWSEFLASRKKAKELLVPLAALQEKRNALNEQVHVRWRARRRSEIDQHYSVEERKLSNEAAVFDLEAQKLDLESRILSAKAAVDWLAAVAEVYGDVSISWIDYNTPATTSCLVADRYVFTGDR